MFDADCLSSNSDVVSQTEGTGIRSREGNSSPVELLYDSPVPVSTHDPSGQKHGIQMNNVSGCGITLCDQKTETLMFEGVCIEAVTCCCQVAWERQQLCIRI